MGTGKLLAKPNKLRGNDLPWTSIPSRGSKSTPCRFMLQKLGISSGSYDPAGSKASFFFFFLCKPTISVHTSIHIRMQTTRVSRVYVQVTSRLVLIKLKAANLSRGFYCHVIAVS